MSAVWRDSTIQAQQMLETLSKCHYEKSGDGQTWKTDVIIEGVRTIAMNVIGSVGYGSIQNWAHIASGRSKIPPGHQLTFMEVMLSIVSSHIVAVFVPARILLHPCMPKRIQRIGIATTEFPLYSRDLITQERSAGGRPSTLIGVLVKISNGQGARVIRQPKSPTFLSEDEITGNLFNFTIAGFDTTASTMAFALIMLAIQPEWQDWIIEEIDQVAKSDPKTAYEQSFGLLSRCLAVMVRTNLRPPYLPNSLCTLPSMRPYAFTLPSSALLAAPAPHRT